MIISTNNEDPLASDEVGGAFADALTLIRFIITPVIMALILWQGPDPQVAILASFLFSIAALSDIFADYFGRSTRNALRRLGYLDDAADTVLIVSVLLALSVVLWRNDLFHWTFAIPVCSLIAREAIIGLLKGMSCRAMVGPIIRSPVPKGVLLYWARFCSSARSG